MTYCILSVLLKQEVKPDVLLLRQWELASQIMGVIFITINLGIKYFEMHHLWGCGWLF